MAEQETSKQPATAGTGSGSAAPATTTATAGEKDEGISKIMRRMKTVLKSGSRSNRASVSSMGEMLGESSKSAPKAAPSSGPPKPKQSAQGRATGTATTSGPSGAAQSAARVQQRRDVQQERARLLFEKYGLTLDPSEWVSRPVNENVERVDKPIRMRVRRNCHRCLTNFGSEKLCPHCHHMRCNKCFRYPPSKPQECAAASTGRAPAAGKAKVKPDQARDGQRKREKVVLTLPSRTGGQDLVRKPIRQRVRRNCHVCNTLFARDATECEQCHHIRCKRCPRDPPKLKKYPDGYPGDVEPPVERQERVYRKPRRRIRWTCHECDKVFAHGHKTCQNCQHDRCERCTRDPPKKIKPEPDPDLLRRVEEKLARIDVSS